MDSGVTAGLLQPVPGVNIPHIHRHNPLGHEGTTWQTGAVGSWAHDDIIYSQKGLSHPGQQQRQI